MASFLTSSDQVRIREAIRAWKFGDEGRTFVQLQVELGIEKAEFNALFYAAKARVPDEGILKKIREVLNPTGVLDCEQMYQLGSDVARREHAQSQTPPGAGPVPLATLGNAPDLDELLACGAKPTNLARGLVAPTQSVEASVQQIREAVGSTIESGTIVDSVVGMPGFAMQLGRLLGVSAYQRQLHHVSFLVGVLMGRTIPDSAHEEHVGAAAKGQIPAPARKRR